MPETTISAATSFERRFRHALRHLRRRSVTHAAARMAPWLQLAWLAAFLLGRAGWPVGYEPGKSLSAFYESTSYAGGNKKHLYSNEFSKGTTSSTSTGRNHRTPRKGSPAPPATTCIRSAYRRRDPRPTRPGQPNARNVIPWPTV